MAMLQRIELGNIYLDLGHVGIFRGLAQQAQLDTEMESALFNALQRKAAPEITELLEQSNLPEDLQSMLSELIWLNGSVDILSQARSRLKSAGLAVHKAIDNLEVIAGQLQAALPGVEMHFDLAELRGYNYHTGVVFAAYKQGIGQSIAQGGRYDCIGQAFGRARPATGFTADLRALMEYSVSDNTPGTGIFAPGDNDAQLLGQIDELRRQGERVVVALPGQSSADAGTMGCDRKLDKQKGKWVVSPV